MPIPNCSLESSITYLEVRYMISLAWLQSHVKNCQPGTSLVAQWLGICLPIQGTWVRVLVREDPTCRGAVEPVSHNY